MSLDDNTITSLSLYLSLSLSLPLENIDIHSPFEILCQDVIACLCLGFEGKRMVETTVEQNNSLIIKKSTNVCKDIILKIVNSSI